jgi:cytochrome c oxidase subunit 2
MTRFRGLLGTSFLIGLIIAGCGGQSDASPELSPAGEQGRAVAVRTGCTSCHGEQGEGVVAPTWQGLFMSEVELEDGTVVVADREYLRRSIVDPEAERVAGYTLQMPAYRPSSIEMAAMLDYLEELK